MNKLIASLAALVAAGACSAAANTEMAFDAEPECAIEVNPTAHGILFEAFALAGGPLSGDYELTVVKDDRDGASDIAQSGEFDLAPGEEAALGESEVSIARGGYYRAELVLSDAAGEICRAERSSRR
jgi:hypothetical protein